MNNYLTFISPIGYITLVENNGFITELKLKVELNDYLDSPTTLLTTAKAQLEEYFEKKRANFTFPFLAIGTSFQEKAWKALLTIPYGQTICYQEQAIIMGNGKAQRAVGGANNKNPLPIIIPCHRVIGKSGKLVGYGEGLSIKEYLLNLEKENSSLYTSQKLL